MPQAPPFALALIALTAGTTVGWFVQRTMASIQFNGDWANLPEWKKRSLAARGSIAALLAGLWVLQSADAFNAWDVVWRMWMLQTLASYMGAPGLELIVKLLGRLKP